jgi:hypothetical protein
VILFYGAHHQSIVEQDGVFIIQEISGQLWNYYSLVVEIHIHPVQIKQKEMNNFFIGHLNKNKISMI